MYHSRCELVLPRLEAADLLLTDPPYELESLPFPLMEEKCLSLYCFGNAEMVAEKWFAQCSMPNKRLLVWHYKNSPKPRGRWRQAMQAIIYGYRNGAPFDEDSVRVEYSDSAKALNGRMRPSAGRMKEAAAYDTSRGGVAPISD